MYTTFYMHIAANLQGKSRDKMTWGLAAWHPLSFLKEKREGNINNVGKGSS